MSSDNNTNEFKLDVSADMQVLNTNMNSSDSSPSSIIHPYKDVSPVESIPFKAYDNIDRIENISFQSYPSLELPESMIFEPTAEKIKPSAQVHQSALHGINFQVKVLPEEALNKATEVGNNLNLVRKDLESLSSQMRNPDNRLNSRDNYDEKITIPAANLIFESRKNKMTQHPEWV
jgi:hypothetical protein